MIMIMIIDSEEHYKMIQNYDFLVLQTTTLKLCLQLALISGH